MLFHSPEFAALLTLTLLAYYLAPRLRVPLLAVANAVFYAGAGAAYLMLFIAIAVLVYGASIRVNGERGRVYLWFGLTASLLNLAVFKYAGFAVGNLNSLFGLDIDPQIRAFALPVGISFYTFQLVAYLVDVHRGRIPPARSLLEFWVFISFFGQLVAGPIMRGGEFLPQVERSGDVRLDVGRFKLGLFLFFVGLGKKLVLADTIAPIADHLFELAGEGRLGGAGSWLAAYLFGFQIYFDFSAYSDMALGIGYLFGYRLAANFRTPYLAANPVELWHRWHITLSEWIRDYIYIPLGGSRRGRARHYLNILVAMVLSGIWHGAGWTFVAWGAYHALLAVGHNLYLRLAGDLVGGPHPSPLPLPLRWLSVLFFFHLTTLGWVFFRADGLPVALDMVAEMAHPFPASLGAAGTTYLAMVAVFFALHLAEHRLRSAPGITYERWRRAVPAPVRALVYAAALALILVFSRVERSEFIYFQF